MKNISLNPEKARCVVVFATGSGGMTDTLQNRDAFLAEMTDEVLRFVVN